MTDAPALVTLAARPDLLEGVLALSGEWPMFMLQDPVALEHQGRLLELAEFQVALVGDAGDVVARALSVPFVWDGQDASLPDRGWDAVLEQAADDLDHGRVGTAVAGLEITIALSHQGRGLTAVMIGGLRDNAARLGFPDVVIPVRPTGKAAEPFTPMTDYAARTRPDDGAPADSWLRAHWRAGGRTVGVCERSMTIPGSIAEWRAWSGTRFPASGPQVVPGGLVPVAVDLERDEAVYVEPNVWVHHRAGGQR
jgi:hypothetical protein